MRGLFQTLLRPDREEDPERTLVARAANILQVGEFQLIQLAYEEWHGAPMPAELCDPVFQAYMMRDEVPSWARHFARWVIRQDEIDAIDAQDPRFHRYDNDYVTHVPQGTRKFILATMAIALFFATALAVGEIAPVNVAQVLPPYFEAETLQER